MIVYILAILLFLIGLYGIIVKRNLIKIVISLMIMEYAINLLFALIGYRDGGTAPIHSEGLNDMVIFVDPLPQALVLTAIVIGLGTTALLVSFAVRIYEKYDTFDVRKIRKLRG
ncbi:MAG: NADH-quinone oxidoreductase subunit K [Dehalococcoidia bacterium]|nr:MAG: NADH-quinone oxidoreductase subunit K [Dehalococcoidia bacterium]